MNKKLKCLPVLGGVLLSFGGCATIFHQPQDRVYVFSTGDEPMRVCANVMRGCESVPTAIYPKTRDVRDHGLELEVNTASERLTVPTPRRISPAFWYNVVWGLPGPIGFGTDYMTGKMWDYSGALFICSSCEGRDRFRFESAPSDGTGKFLLTRVLGALTLTSFIWGNFLQCRPDESACDRMKMAAWWGTFPLGYATYRMAQLSDGERSVYDRWFAVQDERMRRLQEARAGVVFSFRY